MRSFPFTAAVLVAARAFGTPVSAQVTTGPTIQTATVAAGGLLIISGTGFGADAAVTIEGQPVTVLPGGSDTQVTVLAPASVLTTAGTYRLTVTVPGQPADVFVIASQSAHWAAGLAGTTEAAASGAASGSGGTAETAHRATAGPSGAAASKSALAGPAPLIVEDSGAPYRTAITNVYIGQFFNQVLPWAAIGPWE